MTKRIAVVAAGTGCVSAAEPKDSSTYEISFGFATLEPELGFSCVTECTACAMANRIKGLGIGRYWTDKLGPSGSRVCPAGSGASGPASR